MSLVAKLAEAQPRMRGLPCPIATILPKLSDEERIALLDHLEMPQDSEQYLPTTVLAQVLTEAGHRIHYRGVAAHRNMQCRCFTGSGK